MRKFECHITLPREHGDTVKKFWDGQQGWRYKEVGDDGYLMCNGDDQGDLLKKVMEVVTMLRMNGISTSEWGVM